MSFAILEYWVFFALVLALFHSLPFTWGKRLLLVASYFFYARWNATFIILLFATTLIDYSVALRLASCPAAQKRAWLMLSIGANLTVLGVFKYYNFFAASLATLLEIPEGSVYLNVILPVGISFYTFEAMSYTIDVYRGQAKPVRNFLDFALFIALFPHLIAGPIIRAGTFFPQLFDWKPPDVSKVQQAVYRILLGLVKKLVVADQLSLVVDDYFGAMGAHPGAIAAWSAGLAFMFQVMFDFSGYSDIAIGCGKLLGFDFPENFKRPFLAANPAEAWSRWHITLTQWFRDYLFFPLATRRGGILRSAFALFITMTLIGLWHGATWTFVAFGAFHGVVLALYRILRLTRRSKPQRDSSPVHGLKVLGTFSIAVIGGVLFRAQSLDQAAEMYRAMFDISAGVGILGLGHWIMILAVAILGALEERDATLGKLSEGSYAGRLSLYATCVFLLLLFSIPHQTRPFIYFQF